MTDQLLSAPYFCQSEERRRLVRDSGTHNGIEFLEVDPSQTVLRVHFVAPLPGTGADAVPAGPALEASNVVVRGGARVVDPDVVAVSATGSVLDVTVEQPGDFSPYSLAIVTSSVDPTPPAGFDPKLSTVEFSFKANCPSPFDCADGHVCQPTPHDPVDIDYLAKDYESFRRLMLDRMSALLPGWDREHPADPAVALVEALAYTGDRLSYFQDAVATEAYLATARRRISVRRHARLLDYPMHDGSNARTWVSFETSNPVVLPESSPILSGLGLGPVVAPDRFEAVLAEERPSVFETVEQIELRPERNRIDFYTWGDSECCLPAGATAATVINDPALDLSVGQILILEELRDPETGAVADADRSHRHAVRLTEVRDTAGGGGPLSDPITGQAVAEICWADEDRLPFPLCVSARFIDPTGAEVVDVVGAIRGNVVLCDEGLRVPEITIEPDRAPADGPYRPKLHTLALTRADGSVGDGPDERPASARLAGSPHAATPIVALTDETGERWHPVPDLLASDPFAPVFTVETDDAGVPNLRFGDGERGRRPPPLMRFVADGRVGNGAGGNLGPGALGRVVFDGPEITAVDNPLPALGGTDPEPVEKVKIMAPQAFRTQERAVTAEDYAEMAARHPEVQQAVAQFRWTGSWYTVFVTVDRRGGLPVDERFRAELVAFLETFRMAGHDLEIRPPVFVGIDLALLVCLDDRAFPAELRREILDRLGNRIQADRKLGLFHPDRFVFGTPVHLSRIYSEVATIPGVRSVEATRFHRFGQKPAGELAEGIVRPSGSEILRLDNDPNFPERGTIEIVFGGGR